MKSCLCRIGSSAPRSGHTRAHGMSLTSACRRLNPSLRRPEWYKDWTEEETRHLWLEFTNGGQPTDAHAGPEEKKPE